MPSDDCGCLRRPAADLGEYGNCGTFPKTIFYVINNNDNDDG
jgi:hypothetical protein